MHRPAARRRPELGDLAVELLEVEWEHRIARVFVQEAAYVVEVGVGRRMQIDFGHARLGKQLSRIGTVPRQTRWARTYRCRIDNRGGEGGGAIQCASWFPWRRDVGAGGGARALRRGDGGCRAFRSRRRRSVRAAAEGGRAAAATSTSRRSQSSFLFGTTIYRFHALEHWCWGGGAIYEERHGWSYDGSSTSCLEHGVPAERWFYTYWAGIGTSGHYLEERAHVTNCVFHVGDWKEFYPDVKIWIRADGSYTAATGN